MPGPLNMADLYEKMFETSLKHVGYHAEKADKLAYAIYELITGGDPEEPAQLLEQYGYTDPETGDWIYGDEE